MSTIAFDTLKHAERLEKAGLTREQAGAMAEAQKEVFAEALESQLAAHGAGEIVGSAAIEGRLLALLLDRARLEADPELEAVRRYLLAAGGDDDALDRRAVQLASRLARLF